MVARDAEVSPIRSSPAEPAPIIGESSAMMRLAQRIEVAAQNDEPVLIVGETGTGKELVARWIHAKSARATRPLAVVNCAAIPPDLISSELFGHVAGSFTGATGNRLGRLRAATGSSVFLDEICSTASEIQAALLRVIEYGDIQPVGNDASTTRVDVRFIAATNKGAEELVGGDTLREDLFYRLTGNFIEIVPLRYRKEDIPLLALHFLQRVVERNGDKKRLSASMIDTLMEHDFPGNVRELRQAIVASYAGCPGKVIDDRHLRIPLRHRSVAPASQPGPPGRGYELHSLIRSHIVRTLAATNGNLSGCARLLRIPRSTLQHHLARYGINAAALRTSVSL